MKKETTTILFVMFMIVSMMLYNEMQLSKKLQTDNESSALENKSELKELEYLKNIHANINTNYANKVCRRCDKLMMRDSIQRVLTKKLY